MNIRGLARRVLPSPNFLRPRPPASIGGREVAERFRRECATYGPWELAALVGAPPEVEDLRLIAYLFAHSIAPLEAQELCVERGIIGLEEWLTEHPEDTHERTS